MSFCLPKPSEAVNLIKNKRAIVPRNPKATRDEIVESVDFVDALLSDEKTEQGRYQTFDKSVTVKKRVTDRIKSTFEVGRSKEELEKYAQENEKYNLFGTHIHAVMEAMGKAKINKSYKKERPAILDMLRSKHGLTEETLVMLEDEMDSILSHLQKLQNEIDPNENFVVRFEKRLLDPIQDEAGTADMVAFFSDGTAFIYDFKTKKDKGFASLYNRDNFSHYKIQLARYKQILIERHNVKSVRGGRVVPIAVKFKSVYDKKASKWTETDTVNDVKVGVKFGKKYEQKMVLPEITEIKAIDNFILSLYDKLEKKGNVELENLLNSLVISHDLQSVVTYYHNLAKEIMQRYEEQKGFRTEDYDAFNEVRIGAQFLDQLKKEFKLLDKFPEIEKQKNEATTLIDELIRVYSQLEELREDVLINRVYREANRPKPEKGKELIFKEESAFTKYLAPLSEFSNVLFKYLRGIIDKIQYDTRKGLYEDEKKIQEAESKLHEWYKRTGKTREDFVNLIFNRETENLYSEFSKEFYEQREQAVKQPDYEWITKRFKPKDWYPEWYEKAYKKRVEELEEKYSDEIQRDEFIKAWKKTHDLSLDKNGIPNNPLAWTTFKYVELRDEYKDEARSEQFKKIAAEPEVLNYYRTMEEMNEKFRTLLGLKNKKIPNNFVPFIRKDMVEKFREKDGLNKSWEEIRSMFSIREDETGYGYINDLTGKFDDKIPIYFTNPFRNDDGSIKKGEKSTDFGRTMLMMSKMAHNYHYASYYEAHVQAVRELVEKSQYVKTDSKGNWILDTVGRVKTKMSVDPVKIFDTFVDKYFYGKDLQDKGKIISIFGKEVNTNQILSKGMTWFSLKTLGLNFVPAVASFTSARLNAWMDGNEGTLYNNEQWWKATKKMTSDSNHYHGLFKFFGVSTDDVLSTLSLTKKGSIVGNNLYPDNFRKYVSSRMLMMGYRLGEEYIQAHMTNAMAENYVVNPQGVVRRKDNVTGDEWKTIAEIFKIDEDGNVTIEHIAGKNEEERLENIKKMATRFKRAARTGIRGVTGSLSDDDVMFAQNYLVGKALLQFRSWMPGVLNKRFGNLHYSDNIDALKWGKYKAMWSDINVAEASAFSHYMTKGLAPTLLQVAKDLTLGTISIGTLGRYDVVNRYNSNEQYKESVDAWWEKWKAENSAEYDMLIEMYGGEEKVMENILQIKERSIRATVNELRLGLLLFSLVLFLKSDFDDDDEELWQEMFLTHKALQLADRTLMELKFAYDPTSLQAILKGTAVPVIGLLIDTTNVIKELFELAGENIFGMEDAKNDKELGDRLAKWIGPVHNMLRTFDARDTDESAQQ